MINSKYETEISKLAYRFWEEEGRPEGRAEAHWLRAAKELSIPDMAPAANDAAAKPARKAKAKR
jgi:hypothetical protein